VLEGQVAVQLFGALVLAPAQHVARVDQRLPLPGDAPVQLRHVVRQQAILPAHEIQVLVARQQVAEGLRREQHLVPVQRPPFGDVDQPALQDGALLGEGVLGEQQVDRGPVDLVRQRIDLAVQLVHDAIGRLLLSLDVRELIGERVHLGAQPLELLLDVGPLAANAFQPLLVIPQLLIEGGRSLRGEGRCKKSVAERRRENTSRKTVVAVTPFRDVSSRRLSVTPHTRRRCLPTDAALPNSPISVPNPTIASAWTLRATPANAAPTTSPTAAAICRSRSSFSTQSRPNRTSSTNPNPRSRSATSFTCSASRNLGLSFTSMEAGSGLRSSSCNTSRNSTSSARARASAESSLTYTAECTSGNASMSFSASVMDSIGVPGRR